MHIFGKVLGIFFGFLFGGPIGALFGLFLGHQFDKARRLTQAGFRASSAFSGGPNQAEKQAEFFKAAFSVMGHVAKAKGQVTKEEIQLASTMMDRMSLHGEQKRAAQDAFREGKSSDFPLQQVLERVRISSGGRFDLLQFFWNCRYRLPLPMVSWILRKEPFFIPSQGGLGSPRSNWNSACKCNKRPFAFIEKAVAAVGSISHMVNMVEGGSKLMRLTIFRTPIKCWE